MHNTGFARAAIICAVFLPIVSVDVWAAKASAVCAPAAVAQSEAVKAIAGVLAAMQADDEAQFKALTTADFYAYDAGKRFSGAELFGVVKSAHAAGKKYEWTVTEPQVHVLCDWAWITYVNKGAFEDASGRQELTWLESAILRYDGGRWRVQFLHSTRVQAP